MATAQKDGVAKRSTVKAKAKTQTQATAPRKAAASVSKATSKTTSKATAKAKPKAVPKAAAKAAPKVKATAKATSRKTTSAKPGKPPKINWGPQQFMVSHLKDGVFKAGLRAYAQYRDLGVEKATSGAVQAHVIRLKGKCDPKVVSIPHYHGVQFQMIYFLKGWMVGEYEGHGRVKMTAGSCWIQPPGIRHTVLDYSPDCEMVEIILPAHFKTVEVD
jgi:quercetin dioxygenase-like cupin family protein